MTGSDLAAWIGVLAAVFGAMFAVWRFVDGKINRAAKKAENVERELAEHKLHVAETYATRAGVAEQIAGLSTDIKDGFSHVNQRFDAMTERLDRMIDDRIRPIKRHIDG